MRTGIDRLIAIASRQFQRVKEYAQRNSWLTVIGLSLTVLVFLVLTLGKIVGFVSMQSRLLLSLGILISSALTFILFRRRDAKRRQGLTKPLLHLREQGYAHEAPLATLRTEIEKEMAMLRQSCGEQAVRAFPWYLVIGPAASGKTTALVKSGLKFVYPREVPPEVQGFGGTRNCDWRCANEAVFLDTAGRYATDQRNQQEFSLIIDVIREFRPPDKPLNGVIVVVSLPDLLSGDRQKAEQEAVEIRSHLDEIGAQLRVVYPVYLVLTKCDLVDGFVEFFSDSRAERDADVWGCTFSLAQSREHSPRQLFELEFNRLLDALQIYRNKRLLEVLGRNLAKDVFAFPIQLELIRDKLSDFVELLFSHQRFGSSAACRGFYLASGTQEGVPIDEAGYALARRFGLPEPVSLPYEEPRTTDSYFLKAFFEKVVIPDKNLVFPSPVEIQRREFQAKLVFYTGAIVVATCFCMAAWSFAQNWNVLRTVETSACNAYRLVANVAANCDANDEDIEQSFNEFRQVVQQLYDDHEDERIIGLWKVPGVHQGSALYEPARRLYIDLFHQLYRKPLVDQIERKLQELINSPQAVKDALAQGKYASFTEYYSYLKLYLILARPSGRPLAPSIDSTFVSDRLIAVWRSRLKSENPVNEVEQSTRDRFELYSLLLTPELAKAEQNPSLVTAAKHVLEQVEYRYRVYAWLRENEGRAKNPLTIHSFLPSESSVLRSKRATIVGADGPFSVLGIFTPEFATHSLDESIQKAREQFYKDSWVLSLPTLKEPGTEITDQIKKLYRADYRKQWHGFLRDIDTSDPVSTSEQRDVLIALAGEDSLLDKVLSGADEHTHLNSEACGILEGLKSSSKEDEITADFKPLHKFVFSCDREKSPPPLQQYLKELLRYREALAPPVNKTLIVEVQDRISRLIGQLEGTVELDIRDLLRKPLGGGTLDYKWMTVCQAAMQAFGSRYPFSLSTSDLAFEDLILYFHPDTGKFAPFFKDLQEESLASSYSPAVGSSIRQAQAISDGLFVAGAKGPLAKFQLRPIIRHQIPFVTAIQLSAHGQALQYQGGAEEFELVTWPSASEEPDAFLQIKAGSSKADEKFYPAKEFKGPWALLRLIEAGRPTPTNNEQRLYVLSWNFRSDKGEPIVVNIELKSPFKPGIFRDFRCGIQQGGGSVS